MRSTAERARRLILAATGDESPDGYIVTDYAEDYAEPGYRKSAPDGLVVFGDWNPPRYPREGDAPLTKEETIAPRLGDALESIGCDVEWLDEWTTCDECYRAMRTAADSYSWTMFGAFVENACAYVCGDCLLADVDQSLEDCDIVNNPRSAVTWCTARDLESAGWERYERGDPKEYASGWYEGQNDDPEAITAEIRARYGDAIRVVFLIDGVGQFDCHFGAYLKAPEAGGIYSHEYPDGDEHEYHATYDECEVGVTKVGGGTVGESYPGAWHYCRSVGGVVTHRGSDLDVSHPIDHETAAAMAADLIVGEW